MNIEFYKHNISDLDISELISTLHSSFLTTGDAVKLFEESLAKYTRNTHAVGLSSCTSCLFLALKYFNIGPGDEVITTPLSFIATANAIEQAGAKPVFVDVDEKTGNIDITRIESVITKKTKAIIPVHLYGQMIDINHLKSTTDKYNLKIIEDAAHCIEGTFLGVRPGNMSDCACFSFYATKSITSGEGGALVTNNQHMHDWFLKARLHGMSKSAIDRYTKKYEHYDMDILGYKENMSNIDASLLIHQLQRIDALHKRRREIIKQYIAGFKESSTIRLIEDLIGVTNANHIFTIRVPEKVRDIYISKLQDLGIGVAVHFRPIHLMSYYKKKYKYSLGDFPVAEQIGASTISLPLYPKLQDSEIQYIINSVLAIGENFKKASL